MQRPSSFPAAPGSGVVGFRGSGTLLFVVVVTILLLILSPVLLVVALAVWLDSRPPIIY